MKGKRDPVSHRTPEQIRKMDRGYNATPEMVKKRTMNNQARSMFMLMVSNAVFSRSSASSFDSV